MMTRDDDGFTLVEMLISIVLTAIIMTVLVAAFLVFFKNTAYTSGRDDHAAGAEVLSSFLDRDLASATAYSVAGGALTPCSGGSQQLLNLTWTEYGLPAGTPAGDADPAPTGTAYTAAYTLEHDDTTTGGNLCMIRRTVTGGTGSVVLIRGLANVGVQKPASGTSCGGSGQSVLVTLDQYHSTTTADTSPSYRYTGCLKARTDGLP